MQSKVVLGHIALIQRSKRQDFVLDIIDGLRKKGYDAIGLFAGECRELEYLEELQAKIQMLHLEQNVLMLGRRNDIPDLLKSIDVLMIPSVEGFPLAGLEAASAGVSVAACDAAGAKEFVTASTAGMIFHENDVMDAIKAIEYIIENKDILSDNGKHFANDCSYEVYSAKLHDIFASV